MFDVGDKVVYPHHGAGTVVSKDVKLVLGEEREYLTIKILHNEMTVNVPVDNAEKVGLRWVIDQEMVEVVVKVLLGGSTEMPKNWNRRFKHNRDKMKTGDILELAEVVRNLALRDHEKGLSTGEKQMYVKAKKILASELMYAKDLSEDDAHAWLEEVLANPAKGKRAKGQAEDGRRRDRLAAPSKSSRRRDAPRDGRAVRSRPWTQGSAQTTWAVLVAAGTGERLGADRPKAFAALAGRPLLAESLERLDASEWVDAIVVAAPPGWEEPAILLAEELVASKVTSVVGRRGDPRGVGPQCARGGRATRRSSCSSTTPPVRSSTTP